jgi:hypothetical protein
MKRIDSILNRLAGRPLDDKGTAIIEMAIVMPVLLLMTFGIIEIGMMMATQTSLEGGLKEASRYGITGQSPNDSTRVEKIRKLLDSHTIDMVDFAEAEFSVRTYPSFSGVGEPEPFADSAPGTDEEPNPCHNGRYDSDPDCHESFTDLDSDGTWDEDIGAEGAGAAGEVVSYTVTVPWHTMTPWVGWLLARNAEGTVPLIATIVVRNEPNLN